MHDIDEYLVRKYTNGFMYTDYPHKSNWSGSFNDSDYRTALKDLFLAKKVVPVMLYVHIPYCSKLCYYCLCHVIVTKRYEEVKSYLHSLYLEIDLLREFFNDNSATPDIREIHLGGGCPTVIEEKEFDGLIEKIQTIVDVKKLTEFSIEIDPRTVAGNKEKLKYYHSKGINRISIGVQDFDPEVQKAINRIQPRKLIDDLLTHDVRERFDSVNFDILVGLPGQTRETFGKTIETVIEMSPDRIDLAFFNYAPRNNPHMKILENRGRLNDIERHRLFLDATEALISNGYVRIGFDHFAKKTDSVAKAMNNKELRWNSLGFSSGKCHDMLGIGVGSSGRITERYYFQNFYEVSDYEKFLKEGEFPIFRGTKLSRDDIIRRDIINQLRSYYTVEYKEIEDKYGIEFKEYFKDEEILLHEFANDNILELSNDMITITETGKDFCNLVCRIFDNYNRREGFFENFFEIHRSSDFGVTTPSGQG